MQYMCVTTPASSPEPCMKDFEGPHKHDSSAAPQKMCHTGAEIPVSVEKHTPLTRAFALQTSGRNFLSSL